MVDTPNAFQEEHMNNMSLFNYRWDSDMGHGEDCDRCNAASGRLGKTRQHEFHGFDAFTGEQRDVFLGHTNCKHCDKEIGRAHV